MPIAIWIRVSRRFILNLDAHPLLVRGSEKFCGSASICGQILAAHLRNWYF